MTQQDEEAVRTRAHRIWEEAGRPDGEHESHWLQALKELGLASPLDVPAGATVDPEEKSRSAIS